MGHSQATQNYHAAAATLDDFVRNLKLNASEAFIAALAAMRRTPASPLAQA